MHPSMRDVPSNLLAVPLSSHHTLPHPRILSSLARARYDVSMREMRTVIFGDQPQGRSRRASWWKSHFDCKAWHTCTAVPLRDAAAPEGSPTHDVDLQVCESLSPDLLEQHSVSRDPSATRP